MKQTAKRTKLYNERFIQQQKIQQYRGKNMAKKIEEENVNLKEDAGWDKVESELFAFDKDNPSLIGEYVGCELGGKFLDSRIHTMKTGDKTVRFFGSTMLNSLLIGNEGKILKIVYVGEKETDKGNPLKMFEVYSKA